MQENQKVMQMMMRINRQKDLLFYEIVMDNSIQESKLITGNIKQKNLKMQ